jgi:hypothetical protein
LTSIDASLAKNTRKAIQSTLGALLSNGMAIARDLDGNGPKSPRWLPGAGFASFATPRMKHIYSRYLPGARSGDQLLAYATLIEENMPIEIDLKHLTCSLNTCKEVRSWHFETLNSFLENNPLFSITPTK